MKRLKHAIRKLTALASLSVLAYGATYDATLLWQHNQATNMIFNVWGSETNSTNFSLLGSVTNMTSFRLTGLPFNVTNYFNVTAKSPVSGLQSMPSATVGYVLVLPDAPFSLSISNVNINLP